VVIFESCFHSVLEAFVERGYGKLNLVWGIAVIGVGAGELGGEGGDFLMNRLC